MAIIRQYRPAFFSDFLDYKEEQFLSLEELLNIDWVAKFGNSRSFRQFSLSDDNTLMGEYENGYSWFVIGFIKDGGEIIKKLPIWEPKYRNNDKY